MLRLTSLLLLIALLHPGATSAFVDPPDLNPSTASPGQIVNLTLRTGGCDAVLGGANNPAISVDGNAVDVLIDASRRFDPILCVFPIISHSWPIGSFPVGSYSVTVRYRYTPFGLPTVVETLGVLSLSVQGQPALPSRPVSTTGLMAFVVLLVAIVLIGGVAMRKRSFLAIFLVSMLGIQATTIDAQPAETRKRLHVMLSSNPSAPTPIDIVENWDFSSPPPTPGLGAGTPLSAWYFLPIRAAGDFKALLEKNPDTPRAKLERYVVIEYPESANLTEVISALGADENIENAALPIELEFSSATLTGFTIETMVPLGGGFNYGWGVMTQ